MFVCVCVGGGGGDVGFSYVYYNISNYEEEMFSEGLSIISLGSPYMRNIPFN